VSGFKGLENEVVILTDLPSVDAMTPWEKSIFYVGMTRARSKLYALVDKAFLDARIR
jgi:superfamily I DNA/RNA helicase